MRFEKEIKRAVKHINALNPQDSKSQSELDSIVLRIKNDAINRNYNFENAEKIILNQNGKRRLVKKYDEIYSSENVLCHFIKQVLDRSFRVKYPNRNKITKDLFEVLIAIKQMSAFTIIRFDFKDYFNSLSSEYVYERYLKSHISDRLSSQIIEDFCHTMEYTYAGLPTSNALAEIIASYFDEEIKQRFIDDGIVFYERYIDDGLLIFNRFIEEERIRKELNGILEIIFYDKSIKVKKKCKTTFNQKKYSYINNRILDSSSTHFDFLGYEFWLRKDNNKIKIQYGITLEKRKKYQDRLNRIIRYFTDPSSSDYNNMELLRHRVAAFSSRVVYLGARHRSNVWKVKGFISNYSELRFLLESELLHSETEHFLKNMIEDAFEKSGVKPYFILVSPKTTPGYNLYQNMIVNKTILLVDGIGYDYPSLIKLCSKIGIETIDASGKKRSYASLVREYLIKVKVGF